MLREASLREKREIKERGIAMLKRGAELREVQRYFDVCRRTVQRWQRERERRSAAKAAAEAASDNDDE